MMRRDYIIRMIQELGQALARIRKKVEASQFEEAHSDLDATFRELVGKGPDEVAQLPETELLAQLTLDGPTQLVREKTLILTALLTEAGNVRAAQDRDADAEACWLKALNLVLTVALQDADFEFPEFVPKIDFLRDLLSDSELPLPTLAGLWRHYEKTKEFGRAEDALSDLLEAQPDNATLKEEARLFYRRLLAENDATLESGNLPRAEIKTALESLAA